MALDIGALALRRQPAPPVVRQQTPLRVQKSHDGRYIVTAQLPARAGALAGSSVTVAVPASALNGLLTIGGNGEMVEIAGLFGDIMKGISKVVKSDFVQGAAAGALSLYGIPPGITKQAMEASGNLLSAAAQGHPKAKAKIVQVRSQAAAGHPVAQRAHAALRIRAKANVHTRGAMTLLFRAQSGDQHAAARIQQIEVTANRGEPRARRAMAAMQAVVNASRLAAGQPPPPVVRRPAPPVLAQRPPPPVLARRPAPPVHHAVQTLAPSQARVLNARRMPNGKQHVLLEVSGATAESLKAWLKDGVDRRLGRSGTWIRKTR